MEVAVRAQLSGFTEGQVQVQGLAASLDKLANPARFNQMAAATRMNAQEVDKLDRELSQLRSRLDPTYAAVKRLESGQQTLNDAMRHGMLNTRQYNDALTKLRSEYRASTAANDSLYGAFGKLQHIVVAVRSAFFAFAGAAGVGAVAASLFDAGTQMQKFTIAFAAAAGSAREGASNLDFVRKLTSDLGVSFVATAGAFQKFSAAVQGTRLEGEETRRIFTAFSGASRVLGHSAQDTGLIFLALEQMVSKGRVSTEELRRQLGERLPGAFRLAAEALGVTTAQLDKMLRDGAITADKFLPLLAAKVEEVYGKSVPEAAGLAIAELERLRNKWLEVRAAFAQDSGFMSAAGGFLRFGTLALDELASGAEMRKAGVATMPELRQFRAEQQSIAVSDAILMARAKGLKKPDVFGDPFFGDPGFSFAVPTPGDIGKFEKEQAKLRDKAAKEAQKHAEVVAKAQQTWDEMVSRDRLEASQALAKQEQKNERERRDAIERTNKALVESAKVMQEQSENMVFTWDAFGNRVQMTKDAFAEMPRQMAAIFGSDSFSGSGVLGGTHQGLTGEINQTLRGNQGLAGLAKSAGQVVVDEMTREISRNLSRELLKPFKGAFEDIGASVGGWIKDVFGGVWSWLSSSSAAAGGSAGGAFASSFAAAMAPIAGVIGGAIDWMKFPEINLGTFATSGMSGFGSFFSQIPVVGDLFGGIGDTIGDVFGFPTGTSGSVYTSPSLIMVGDAGPEMVSVSPMGGAAHGRGMGGNLIVQSPVVIMDAYTQKRFARMMGRL